MRPDRRLGLLVAAGGLLGFVALAAWWVPWDPVPGGPLRTPDPEEHFRAAELARAEAYAGTQRLLGWSSLAVSVLVACLLGFTRLGPALLDRLPGWQRLRWWLQVPYAVAAVLLVGRLATLPLSVALRYRAREYGLSVQPWGGYARDLALGFGVDAAATALALLAVIGLARWLRRWWPLVAAGTAAALVFVGSYLYPVLVEPLFAEFTPVPNGELRGEILALAEQEDVPVDEVLLSDASERTTTLNAYVSGLGETRRVVLYDTLVHEVPSEQTLGIVAHELAHAKHDDVLTGTVLGMLGVGAGVGLLAVLLPVTRRHPQVEPRPSLVEPRRPSRPERVETDPLVEPRARSARERVETPSVANPTSIPRILALVALATVITAPIQNGISRQIETRADVDAIRAVTTVRGPEGAEAYVEMQTELARRALSDLTPPAWSEWWFASHPGTLERIALVERVAGQD